MPVGQTYFVDMTDSGFRTPVSNSEAENQQRTRKSLKLIRFVVSLPSAPALTTGFGPQSGQKLATQIQSAGISRAERYAYSQVDLEQSARGSGTDTWPRSTTIPGQLQASIGDDKSVYPDPLRGATGATLHNSVGPLSAHEITPENKTTATVGESDHGNIANPMIHPVSQATRTLADLKVAINGKAPGSDGVAWSDRRVTVTVGPKSIKFLLGRNRPVTFANTEEGLEVEGLFVSGRNRDLGPPRLTFDRNHLGTDGSESALRLTSFANYTNPNGTISENAHSYTWELKVGEQVSVLSARTEGIDPNDSDIPISSGTQWTYKEARAKKKILQKLPRWDQVVGDEESVKTERMLAGGNTHLDES